MATEFDYLDDVEMDRIEKERPSTEFLLIPASLYPDLLLALVDAVNHNKRLASHSDGGMLRYFGDKADGQTYIREALRFVKREVRCV